MRKRICSKKSCTNKTNSKKYTKVTLAILSAMLLATGCSTQNTESEEITRNTRGMDTTLESVQESTSRKNTLDEQVTSEENTEKETVQEELTEETTSEEDYDSDLNRGDAFGTEVVAIEGFKPISQVEEEYLLITWLLKVLCNYFIL